MIEGIERLKMEETHHSMIKGRKDKPRANIMPNREKTQQFPAKIRKG